MNTDYGMRLADLLPNLDTDVDMDRFWAWLAEHEPENIARLREVNEALVLDMYGQAYRRARYAQLFDRFLGNTDELKVTQSDFVLLG